MHACFAVLIAPCLALVAATPDKAPFPMDWSTHAQTAVDLSCHLDAPAGRDGFLRATDGRLVKPDGSRFRIWGVNICGPQWNEERNAIPVWGRAPVLIEPVTGAVTLRGLDAKSLRARALTAAGVPTDAAIPVAASAGAFTLTLGTPPATMVLIESGR